MKTNGLVLSLISLSIVAGSSFARAAEMLPFDQISYACGMKRVSLQDFKSKFKSNINNIDVTGEDIEGSEDQDNSTGLLKLTLNTAESFSYSASGVRLFAQGTPSYTYNVKVSFDKTSFVPETESSSALLKRSKIQIDAISPNGKRQSSKIDSNSSAILSIEGKHSMIQSLDLSSEQNAAFMTEENVYAIRCRFSQ